MHAEIAFKAGRFRGGDRESGKLQSQAMQRGSQCLSYKYKQAFAHVL